MTQKALGFILGCCLFLGICGSASQASYPYTYYNPTYWGGYGNQFAGPGGYLHGASTVIDATGNLYVQQEKARVEREKANQAKLDTKRKAFDEMMYEKANTPTFTETQEYNKAILTRRLMTNPVPAEIARGETLNAMLPLVRELSSRGIQGPPVSLNSYQLKQVNVAPAGGSGGTANLGMLKDVKQLEWPIVLQSPKQEKLAAGLPTLVDKAATGRLDLKAYKQATSEIRDLQEDWRKQFHKEEIDGGTYLTGKRFLDKLEASIKGLQEPGSRKILDRSYAAEGGNVPELVYNMSQKGLTFVPANSGDESAYYSLHDAFVAYVTAAQASSGFQVRFNPPRTDPYVNK